MKGLSDRAFTKMSLMKFEACLLIVELTMSELN